MPASIDELVLGDPPEAWAALGFAVEAGVCRLGEARLRLAGREAGSGLVSWSLRGVEDTGLDGLATSRSDAGPRPPAPAHPNGVAGLDHVVAVTPDLERTVAALEGAGLELRRIREEPTPAGAPRQAFFRLGGPILEVVQEPPELAAGNGASRPAFFWGIALLAPDLERTVAALGEAAGEARPAVQPGRRIATLRRSAGLGLPVALISPPPGGPQSPSRTAG